VNEHDRPELPLIVGEAPSRTGDRYYLFPLSGDPAVKMCRWAGWEREAGVAAFWTLREHADTVNLLDRGAALPDALAKPAWQALLPDLAGRVVVLLGSRLGRLAGVDERFKWEIVESEHGPFACVVVPHTSGLNHAYNDADVRAETGRILREACTIATWAAAQRAEQAR
jgi:hypothetical protein